MIKIFSFIQHETDADREDEEISFHLLAESAGPLQSGSIFFSGDNDLRFRKSCKSLIDLLNILQAEIMVVRVGERCDVSRFYLGKVLHDLLGRGDAREQEHVLSLD